MAAAVESGAALNDAMDGEDAIFPCKGCGEILEEGKAFELAGHRWHIDCFRCNTCQTLLDSDANLLLLGDGSLICNNCTYSCSACGQKIEDLAILTGNEAFCASCFKCRNCKRKIDNLRYARTSQGIFCMACHESLMQRRRANKAGRNKTSSSSRRDASSASAGSGSYEKRLPELPQKALAPQSAFSPDESSPASSQGTSSKNNDYVNYKHQSPSSNYDTSRGMHSQRVGGMRPDISLESTRSLSPPPNLVLGVTDPGTENLTLASSTYGSDSRVVSNSSAIPEESNDEDFMIPMTLDTGEARQNRQARSGLTEEPVSGTLASSDVPSTSTDRKTSENRRAGFSPHIAYQEKGRQSSSDRIKRPNTASSTPPATGNGSPKATAPDQSATSPETNAATEDFQLREPPARRKSGESKPQTQAPMSLAGQTEGSPVSQQSTRTLSPPPRRDNYQRSPLSVSTDERSVANDFPVRSDSVSGSKKASSAAAVPRKEVPRTETELESAKEEAKKVPQREKSSLATTLGGSLNASQSTLRDTPEEPPRSANRPTHDDRDKYPEFMAPRTAPTPPTLSQRHKASESMGSITSETFLSSRDAHSPQPPEYAAETSENLGLLRKMSKITGKHGRSHSDKINNTAMPSPKWGKGSRNGSVDISSPLLNDPRDDVASLRSRLKNYEARIAELEAANHALEEKATGTEEIRHVTTEIREKRSTVEFLESQREITFKEIDVIMEAVSRQKNKPEFNYPNFKENVINDLRDSLERLKDQFEVKIRELVHQKNELTTEITNLIQMKDKGFAEYETLNNRIRENQDIYNRLVESSRDLMEAGKVPMNGSNGLGIQIGHSRDVRSDGLMDLRTNFKGSDVSSGTTLGVDHDVETPTVEGVPQVVNIRKGQPKKFNWGRGREKVTKNITKGFRGAFGGNQQPGMERDGLQETAPYSAIQPGSQPSIGDAPIGQTNSKNYQGTANKISAPVAQPQAGATGGLFGIDLTQRCEKEGAIIPSVVLRCAGDVEERGLDVEGIYRKSGAAPDVTKLKTQFETLESYDIDPEVDIHAVAGCLKNYFHKLPIPLIPWDSYDPLLNATAIENDESRRVYELRKVINNMPQAHRHTLEFLLFHLNNVISRNKVNLMTSTNIAVCFAPTIMRPRQVNRELTDMEIQRKSVELLLKHGEKLFQSS